MLIELNSERETVSLRDWKTVSNCIALFHNKSYDLLSRIEVAYKYVLEIYEKIYVESYYIINNNNYKK